MKNAMWFITVLFYYIYSTFSMFKILITFFTLFALLKLFNYIEHVRKKSISVSQNNIFVKNIFS